MCHNRDIFFLNNWNLRFGGNANTPTSYPLTPTPTLPKHECTKLHSDLFWTRP